MKIIKSFRKSMSISIDEEGELIIKAPYFLSNNKIMNFVESKKKWIEKQQSKIKQKTEIMKEYDFEDFAYINGEKVSWKEIIINKKMSKASFYSKKATELVINKAKYWANEMNLSAYFKLCNSKCIWGSCNQNKIIKLNWKLVLLNEELQDYVIIHELCHLKEMNHSKQFWNRVEEIDKNYKIHRQLLKKQSLLLRENIF